MYYIIQYANSVNASVQYANSAIATFPLCPNSNMIVILLLQNTGWSGGVGGGYTNYAKTCADCAQGTPPQPGRPRAHWCESKDCQWVGLKVPRGLVNGQCQNNLLSQNSVGK